MLILTFRVRPNKPQTKITQKHESFYDIDLAAPPVDDKANQELIAFIAKEYKVKKASVEIISGHKSKIKRLKIHS